MLRFELAVGRAGISVASNIAEGYGHEVDGKDLNSFVAMARSQIVKLTNAAGDREEVGYGDSIEVTGNSRWSFYEMGKMLGAILVKLSEIVPNPEFQNAELAGEKNGGFG